MIRNRKAIGTISYVATAPFTAERFCYSYAKMMYYNARHLETPDSYIYYDRQQVSWIPRGRNDIAKSLRGDWVFMLDADLEFEPDSFARLLAIAEKYQAPVLTGLYSLKKKPYFPVLYSHNQKRKKYELVARWEGNPDIFQIDASGAGCLFIRNLVFQKMWAELNEDPFSPTRGLGEDFSFFDRCRRIGIGVYVAPQVKFTHLATIGIDYDMESINKNLLTKPYQR